MPLSNGNERFAQGYTLVAVSDPGKYVIRVKSRQEWCEEKMIYCRFFFLFSFCHVLARLR